MLELRDHGRLAVECDAPNRLEFLHELILAHVALAFTGPHIELMLKAFFALELVTARDVSKTRAGRERTRDDALGQGARIHGVGWGGVGVAARGKGARGCINTLPQCGVSNADNGLGFYSRRTRYTRARARGSSFTGALLLLVRRRMLDGVDMLVSGGGACPCACVGGQVARD